MVSTFKRAWLDCFIGSFTKENRNKSDPCENFLFTFKYLIYL